MTSIKLERRENKKLKFGSEERNGSNYAEKLQFAWNFFWNMPTFLENGLEQFS